MNQDRITLPACTNHSKQKLSMQSRHKMNKSTM